jgi:hypothetical protein
MNPKALSAEERELMGAEDWCSKGGAFGCQEGWRSVGRDGEEEGICCGCGCWACGAAGDEEEWRGAILSHPWLGAGAESWERPGLGRLLGRGWEEKEGWWLGEGEYEKGWGKEEEGKGAREEEREPMEEEKWREEEDEDGAGAGEACDEDLEREQSRQLVTKWIGQSRPEGEAEAEGLENKKAGFWRREEGVDDDWCEARGLGAVVVVKGVWRVGEEEKESADLLEGLRAVAAEGTGASPGEKEEEENIEQRTQAWRPCFWQEPSEGGGMR